MKFSFIVPAYNNYKLLHQLLWDIYKNCSPVYEVIVADDGDDTETVDGLDWWTGMLPIKHFRNKAALGFLKNSNSGLKRASGDLLCLVSTDVRIHKDMVGALSTFPEMESRNGKRILLGGRYFTESTGWNEFENKVYPYVEGWLLIASKDSWRDLGYFDERYAPHDFEDVDLSTTALSKGYSLAQITPDAGEVVSHIGAQTIGYNPEREAITQRNKKLFYEKWIA